MVTQLPLQLDMPKLGVDVGVYNIQSVTLRECLYFLLFCWDVDVSVGAGAATLDYEAKGMFVSGVAAQ